MTEPRSPLLTREQIEALAREAEALPLGDVDPEVSKAANRRWREIVEAVSAHTAALVAKDQGTSRVHVLDVVDTQHRHIQELDRELDRSRSQLAALVGIQAQQTEANARLIDAVAKVLADEPAQKDAAEPEHAYAKHPQFVRFDDFRGLLGGTHGLWSQGSPAFFSADLREHLCSYGCGNAPVAVAFTPHLKLRTACADHHEQLKADVLAGREQAQKLTTVPHEIIGPTSDAFTVERDPNPEAN